MKDVIIQVERNLNTMTLKEMAVFKCRVCSFIDLFGADERGHDAHVGRQEELQTHDEDGQDSKRHQLQTVVHQLQREQTKGEPTKNIASEHN